MEDPMSDYTGTAVLCDDNGIIIQGPGVGWPCTGSLHAGGEHLRCTSAAHSTVQVVAPGVYLDGVPLVLQTGVLLDPNGAGR
jgi:hypothetical protein